MKVVGYTSRNERHRSASHRMGSARYGDHATARNDEVHLVLSVWLLRDIGAIVPVEPEAQRRHSQKLFINRSRSQFGDIYDFHPDSLSDASHWRPADAGENADVVRMSSSVSIDGWRTAGLR